MQRGAAAHFSPPGLSSGGRLSFFKFFALLRVFVRLRSPCLKFLRPLPRSGSAAQLASWAPSAAALLCGGCDGLIVAAGVETGVSAECDGFCFCLSRMAL